MNLCVLWKLILLSFDSYCAVQVPVFGDTLYWRDAPHRLLWCLRRPPSLVSTISSVAIRETVIQSFAVEKASPGGEKKGIMCWLVQCLPILEKSDGNVP